MRIRNPFFRPLSGLLLTAATFLSAWTPSLLVADDRFPPELTQFTPLVPAPVFTAAGPDDWDARIRERGYIIRKGDEWWMYYTGYDGTREGLKMLGLATSKDGLTWQRSPQNPLYREHWVEDMCVVEHQGIYHMFAEGYLDRAYRLTSPDGLTWTHQGLLDIRKVDGTPIPNGPYGTPTAWVEDGVWYLFYERRDAGIWLAKSTDLKVWTHVTDEPVLSPGPAGYDRDLIALNQIFRHRDRYYAVFHGASNERTPAVWATGLAVSDDLIHWEKYPGNPLRPIVENKSSGQILPMNGGFRLYTLHDRVDVHQSPRRSAE